VLVIAILLVAEKFFGMWDLVLGVPVAIYVIRVIILDSPVPSPGRTGTPASRPLVAVPGTILTSDPGW